MAKPRETVSPCEAAARREAALQRTAEWRSKNAVWPPPPTGQETPRQVKQAQPPPGLLEQVFICVGQFISGLILSYAAVGTICILMSPFVQKHVPHYKPLASEMPAELLETAFTFVIVIAIAAVFFRKSKVFGLSLAFDGTLYVVFSLAFLGM